MPRAMTIIPAIDLIDGKCVRLTKGDFSTAKTYGDPLEMAKIFEAAGIRRLHVVDLDGAKSGAVVNWKTLEVLAANTSLVIDFSGGIRTEQSVRKAFESGAALVVAGSIAVKDPEQVMNWTEIFGADRFILGADTRDGKVAIHGWKDTSAELLEDFVEKYAAVGVNGVLCTDVDRDGMLEGPSFDLYRRLVAQFPTLDIIASGGVSTLEDLQQLVEIGVSGIIVGKAYYEGRVTLEQLISCEVP